MKYCFRYDPYERPENSMGFAPDVDQFGRPIDPYAEYGRGPPPGRAGRPGQQAPDEEDDFGGYVGYR